MTTRRKSNSILLMALIALLGSTFATLNPFNGRSVAADDPEYAVVLTITHVQVIGDLEGPLCGDPDLFARVWINGVDQGSSPVIEGSADILPDWQFTEDVLLSEESVPVRIEIWEEDFVLSCGLNDQADISPESGEKGIDIVVDLAPCAVSGDLAGGCEQVFVSQGTGEAETLIEFTIFSEPPAGNAVFVTTCSLIENGSLTTVLWPQEGETVDINLQVNQPNGGPTFKAETVEIWIDRDLEDGSEPAAAAATDTETATFRLRDQSFTEDFAYGCRAMADGLETWTGWRQVTVGDPDPGAEVIPVRASGPRASRLDIVLFADEDTYDSATDPVFLSDAASIYNAYLERNIFKLNERMFNFWIALEPAKKDDGSDGDCDHTAPTISWMDAGAIVHQIPSGSFRNCGNRDKKLVSATTKPATTVLHEIGHVPFGLADERDGSGFWQSLDMPNVYHNLEDDHTWSGAFRIGCEADTARAGRDPSDCRLIQDTSTWGWIDDLDQKWYTSDPSVDEMNKGGPFNELDIQRIQWVYAECNSARC